MDKKEKRIGSLLITLRAVAVFLILAGILAVIYWFGYDSYRDVAEWSVPGSRETLIMDGETYTLSGVIGKKGLTAKKYPVGDLLGEVKDDGVPEITVPETEAPTEEPEEDITSETVSEEITSEETEEPTETYAELPDEIVSFVKGDHAYLVYCVDKMDGFILVLVPDGNYYLYYGEDAENPLAS